MSQNPHRRVVVVSAISGVLVFGAAGFAAAATGGGHKVQTPVIAPAAGDTTDVTDASVAAGSGSVVDTLAPSSVGDDNGTEVENEDGTEVQNSQSPSSSEVESDDQGDDDNNQGNTNQSTNQGGDDHGGDHGGGGDDGNGGGDD